MKKLIIFLSLLSFLMIAPIVQAQTPPPPNNGTTSGGGTTPVGGGAPVGSGLAFMLALGLTYSVKKYWENTPEKKIL